MPEPKKNKRFDVTNLRVAIKASQNTQARKDRQASAEILQYYVKGLGKTWWTLEPFGDETGIGLSDKGNGLCSDWNNGGNGAEQGTGHCPGTTCSARIARDGPLCGHIMVMPLGPMFMMMHGSHPAHFSMKHHHRLMMMTGFRQNHGRSKASQGQRQEQCNKK